MARAACVSGQDRLVPVHLSVVWGGFHFKQECLAKTGEAGKSKKDNNQAETPPESAATVRMFMRKVSS